MVKIDHVDGRTIDLTVESWRQGQATRTWLMDTFKQKIGIKLRRLLFRSGALPRSEKKTVRILEPQV